MDVGERGSVKRGDDTRKKSAVTCVSRVPPSSSRAPHSQPFFFFFRFVLSWLFGSFCHRSSATCFSWMSLTVLDLDLGPHCQIHLPTVSLNSSVILEHSPLTCPP